MLRYVETYNNLTIHFDGDEESTVPSPKWVITMHPGCRIWLRGDLPLEEVKKIIENIWH